MQPTRANVAHLHGVVPEKLPRHGHIPLPIIGDVRMRGSSKCRIAKSCASLTGRDSSVQVPESTRFLDERRVLGSLNDRGVKLVPDVELTYAGPNGSLSCAKRI